MVKYEGSHREDYVAPRDQAKKDLPRCGALLASNPDPDARCRNTRGQGTPHPGYGYCSKHQGNTPAGLKSAAREAGHDLITKFKYDNPALYRFGGDRHDPSIASMSPEQALVEEVRRSAAMVRFLEQRIGEWGMDLGDPAVEKFLTATHLRDPEVKKNVDKFLEGLDPADPASKRHLPDLIKVHPDSGIASFTNKREWLYLYREERGHLARAAKMALDAGVAHRLVTLAEDQGRILSSALRAVLLALNLSPEQQALVPIIVPAILRAVANDQPLPDAEDLVRAHATQATVVSSPRRQITSS